MKDRVGQGELLRRHGLRLEKKLGQHFLVDPRVRERIVDAVATLEPERVVEMAAGAGSLTFAMAERGWPVRALEIDARMIELLEAERGERPIEVEACDLAQADFASYVDERRSVFVGNLPYKITSPILFGLLPALEHASVAGAVVMVQSEVARRMVAPPGHRDGGVLSILMQARLRLRRLFVVRPGSFLPPPVVDSAVVEMRRRTDPLELGETGTKLVKVLFGERRKQIGGMLRRHYGLDRRAVESMTAATGIDARARAENLSIEDFVALDDWLQEWKRA